MSALLEVRELTASYGSSQALFGVDLSVGAGEVVALMGRNGMGKTTTVRCICRMMASSRGAITFAGKSLNDLPSHKAAQLGIGLVPEGRRCFAPLSVEENLVCAARPGDWTMDRLGELFPRLSERRKQAARTLSGGEQQMLAIGRALMTNPKLLILDEATEGLAPVIRQEIWRAIAELKKSGLAILIIDKSLRDLKALCDRFVILERGKSEWTGVPAGLSDEICDRYLGV